MSRLLDLPIYRNTPELSSKLRANYRSNAHISQLASSLFYGNLMTGDAPKGNYHFKLNVDLCSNASLNLGKTTMFPGIPFPIKFDHVCGKPSKGISCDR